MEIIDFIQRREVPIPWAEGEKIPWDEPGFSRRMLKEHLSQSHDAASRRLATVEKHVDWIHKVLLASQPARILDLGCGPGLYTSRLAMLGHDCLGIDFSPASIAHARREAEHDRLRCTYLQQDLRGADFGGGYSLAMLIFGEFNTFRPADARHILRKTHQSLAEGGLLLLEAHTFEAVRAAGTGLRKWYSSENGLFSERPHVCLEESFWDGEQNVATTRYFILDGATGDITRHASSMQAYSNEEYRSLLEECGFRDAQFHPSLSGGVDPSQGDYLVIVAKGAGE